MKRLIAICVVLMGFPVAAQARSTEFPVPSQSVSTETVQLATSQRETVAPDPSGATRVRRYQARSNGH